MVRVVKKSPAKEVIKRIVCKNCGATLEYLPREVKEGDGSDYSPVGIGDKYITCPNCKEIVIISRYR